MKHPGRTSEREKEKELKRHRAGLVSTAKPGAFLLSMGNFTGYQHLTKTHQDFNVSKQTPGPSQSCLNSDQVETLSKPWEPQRVPSFGCCE